LTHFETLSALDLRLLLRLGLLALFTLLLASGADFLLVVLAIVVMPSATAVLGDRRSRCDACE
jgi:hypothetical protein